MDEQTMRLIRKLRNALALTKNDAERTGAAYGRQATCVTALKAADRWLATMTPEPTP
jgi:hypothetical protein